MLSNLSHPVDAAIVAIYLFASFGVGLLATRVLRSKRKSEEDYYLAGRKVPGWVNGISYAVTLMNSDVAPAYCGMAVVVGLPVAWFYLSRFGPGLMLAAMLFAVRWRQLGIRTGPEFFSLRFGGRLGRTVRVYSSLMSVGIGMIPWIGAGMLGVHMIFGPVFGIDDKAVTLAIVLPILVIYIWISGFAGVLVTDVLQAAIIVAANLIVLILVLWQFGGPTGLATAVQTALPDRSADILSVMPVPGHAVMGPWVVLAWMIVATIGMGGNVATEGQRIFSCRTTRDAAKVGVWGEAALFLMLLLLTLPALGVLANHPDLYGADPEIRETAYGLMLHDYLPVGLLGIALAALLASVMSTIDSHLNYGSQTLVNDVVRQFMPAMSDRQGIWTGRLLMLVILACAVVVTYASDSLVGIAIVVSGMFGSTLTFSWGQWWWWRVNIWSWFAAMVGGPMVYFALGWLLPHWPWWQQQIEISAAAEQGMAMMQAVIAMTATSTIWVIVTLLTPPEEMAVLKQFYRKAQPMGLWNPVRRAIEREMPNQIQSEQPRGLILGGMATALLGTLWVTLGVLGISALVVGRYGEAVGQIIAAALLALLFQRMFRWHLARLEKG